jgi:hypothetical protein
MFAYRRKRSLGCEQLEGRFAPSSFLVGGGSRSTLRDAQSMDATQAEQAAFYLAASAVLSQSASVANVAPVTFDQPAAGEAAISKPSSPLTSYGDGTPPFPGAVWRIQGFAMTTTGCKAEMGWSAPFEDLYAGDFDTLPSRRVMNGQPADDSGSTADIPCVDPISPETPSEQGNDVDAVGAVPFEEQIAGADDVAAEDFLPVVDDTPVAGDEVADPVGEDTGLPDASHPEEMPRCGNDFEDLGPIEPVGTDTEFTDADGSDEIAVDEVPVEPQFEDTADEVAPVDA